MRSSNEQPKYSAKHCCILSCLSMLYITFVLCSAVLTHKLIDFKGTLTIAGVLLVPFIFSLADITAEIFGYRIAVLVTQGAFFCQLIFALICVSLALLPSPTFWHGQAHYHFVLKPLLRMSVASYLAYSLSSIVNVYTISRWKVLWHGRFFWLRSFCSSIIGELFYSILIVILMGYHTPSNSDLYNMVITSCTVKISFSLLCSVPANWVVFGLRSYLQKGGEQVKEKSLNPFT